MHPFFRWRLLLAAVSLLISSALVAGATGPPYCLESINPLGQEIKKVVFPQQDGLTSGQLARRCVQQCDEDPGCTLAWVASDAAAVGPLCQLHQHRLEDVASLQQHKGGRFGSPGKHAHLSLKHNHSSEASLSWLCFKSRQEWNDYGAAVHDLVMAGNKAAKRSWCAFSTDVAGTIIAVFTNITASQECAPLCVNTPGCRVWLYATAINPGRSGQARHNCFLKGDPLAGENDWTAPVTADIFDPDTSVMCMLQQTDWHNLGLMMNPNIQTFQVDGRYYTLFPERVSFSEANRTCFNLPGEDSGLAVLPSRVLLNTVGRRLLRTVSKKRSLQSAWLAITGINARAAWLDHTTATHSHACNTSANSPSVCLNGQRELLLQHLTERSLHWLDALSATNASSSSSSSSSSASVISSPAAATPGSQHSTAGSSGSADGVGADLASLLAEDASVGTPVDGKLLKHVANLRLQWTVHDIVSQQLLVPDNHVTVCGRVVMQTSPRNELALPSAAAPGIYFFDCSQPAAFICQSSFPSGEPLQGRYSPDAAPSAAPGALRSGTWQLVLAITLPVVLVAALVAATVCLYSQHIDRLADLLALQRRRAQGRPSNGPVSIVATDIQSYSKLMQDKPDAMAKALLLHNSIIRKAAFANAGGILEQEGDAFIVAFHDALDAVSFTLQAQQALLEAVFPADIRYFDKWEHWLDDADISRSSSSSGGSIHLSPDALQGAAATPQQPASASDGVPGRSSSKTGDINSAGDADWPGPGGPEQLAGAGGNRWLIKSLAPTSSNASSMCSSIAASSNSPANAKRPGLLRQQAPATRLGLAPRRFAGSSAPVHEEKGSIQQQHMRLEAAAAGRAPSCAAFLSRAASNVGTLASGSRTSGGGSTRSRGPWWRQLLQPSTVRRQLLFRGLRVRMGVATGTIERGQDITATTAYASARVISDVAVGGQVLLDEATFKAVQQQLQRLGAVTASGLDYQLLGTERPRQACCLQQLCGASDRHSSGDSSSGSDALVLDMGLYDTSPLLPVLFAQPASAAVTAAAGAVSGPGSPTPSLDLSQHNDSRRASGDDADDGAASDAAAAGPSAGDVGQLAGHSGRLDLPPSLSALWQASDSRLSICSSLYACHSHHSLMRLYQVLPPDLAGRAALFGTQLQLREHWRCLDPPYFAAPGLHSIVDGAYRASGGGGGNPRASAQLQLGSTAIQLTDSPMPSGSCGSGRGSEVSQASADCAAGLDSQEDQRNCRALALQLHGPGEGGRSRRALSRTLTALRAASLNCQSLSCDLAGHSGGGRFTCPPVTIVFVAVEGSETLLQPQPHPGTRQLHSLLTQLMLDSLAVVPGGYLVRAQEGELRYMAAFDTPTAAVAWCLVLQEAALYLPFPDQLLQHQQHQPRMAVQHDAAGRLVFRGPRLKMGLAEGTPKCIVPDHQGRADYHGSFVNAAARFCDAAAHGGQIATDSALAHRVLQQWRAEVSSSSSNSSSGSGGGATAASLPGSCNSSLELAGAAGVAGLHSPGAASVCVQLQWLGSFLFKGHTGSLVMVGFSAACHSGRTYPREAPRGKGVRVTQQAGCLATQNVWLPGTVAHCNLWPGGGCGGCGGGVAHHIAVSK